MWTSPVYLFFLLYFLELEMMSLLDHMNIIQIQDGYEDKKRLAIVMEMYPIESHGFLHGFHWMNFVTGCVLCLNFMVHFGLVQWCLLV